MSYPGSHVSIVMANYPSDDEDEDWDEGDGAWTDDDEETALSECPKCGCDIYEDAVQCPLCGEYITRSTSTWHGRPMWWRLLGIAGILAVIAGTLIIIRG